MTPVRRYDSLIAFAEAEAGEEIWREYVEVRSASRGALSRVVSFDDTRPHHEMPFLDAAAAAQYERRCSLERAFTKTILDKSAAGEWVVEAREESSIAMRVLDDRPLRRARFDYGANRLELEGVWYADVSIVRTRALPIIQQMIALVASFAQSHSPQDKTLGDIRAFIREQLEYKFPEETMNRAIAAANLPPEWHAGGRRGPRNKPD